MKKKLKTCSGCQLPKVIWKCHKRDRYCKDCWSKLELECSDPQKPTVIKQPISRVSDKRAKQERAYTVLNKVYLENNPTCVGKIPGICTIKATEVHHASGRVEEKLNDIRDFRALCHACHVWVELHPIEAKELNLSKSRLT
jgi:hypothetical protein